MQFFRVIVGAIFAVTSMGCGEIKSNSAAPKAPEEKSYIKTDTSIEITGQKGVGRREGSTYIKSFTVDNLKTFTEEVVNAHEYLSYTFSMIETPLATQAAPTPHLSYAFTADLNVVGVSAIDATTGAAVSASFKDNVVYLNDGWIGRRIQVKYYAKGTINIESTLRYEPISGSIRINLPECASSMLVTNGKQFSAMCETSDKPIPVSYDFNDVTTQIFSMAEVSNANIGRWEVRINGALTNVYRREGKIFYIDQAIPHAAKVDISYFTE